MTPSQFQSCVDSTTTRSMQWRVRIEAGISRSGMEAEVSPRGRRGTARDGAIGGSFRGADADRRDDAQLDDRVVLEAVIDVSSQRPRVAYLRDVTHLELSFSLARLLRDDGVVAETSIDETALEDDGVADEDAPTPDSLTLADAPTYDPFDDAPDEPESPTPDESGVEPDQSTGASDDDAVDGVDEGVDRRIGRWTKGGAP
jgi:hypothetical protein